jgi:hypothetical protein
LSTWRVQRHAIEVKLRRGKQTEPQALAQVERYLETLGLDEGWLVIFDRRKSLSWKERLRRRTAKRGKKRVHVVGC